MTLIEWFADKWTVVRGWFHRLERGPRGPQGPQGSPLTKGKTVSVDTPIPQAGVLSSQDQMAEGREDRSPNATEAKPNRKARRAMASEARRRYERERKKFDVFVEPKGEKPEVIGKGPYESSDDVAVSAEPSFQMPVEDDTIVVDIHHSDRKTKVLYEEDEFYGEFNFRDSILEQLDRYFVYLKRMRKNDPDAYGFYRQVGAMILPYYSNPDIRKGPRTKATEWTDEYSNVALSSWFLKTRPGFGCIAYGANPETEKIETMSSLKNKTMQCWIPKFLYFTKYKMIPPQIQPMSGGDVYRMTVWWDRPQDKKHENKYGVPEEYAVFIAHDDGKITILRTLETKNVRIQAKKSDSSHKRGEMFSIPQRKWRIPNSYEEWAKLHGTNAQVFLGTLFRDTVETIERAAYSPIRVSVEKDGNHAMFSVDPKRIPYFFKDRDYDLNEKGHRKRIFHVVKAHMKRGKAVPLSFRGERDFTWAGYNVHITVPGLHHQMIEEFKGGVVPQECWDGKEKMISEPKFGKMVREVLNR